jgi:uncharacterized protein YyaL (SSP411 family)
LTRRIAALKLERSPNIIPEAQKVPNRLIHEKSPYLRQHASNPVDWYPWGEEALAAARAQDKPVFLSIGYSSCHWCHVMERESFADEGIARLLNDLYISVKVDREERPDIDAHYISVCQLLTGGGGWPLTVVLTPEKKPFFAGTYFPKESRFGLPGLKDILTRIGEAWKTRRADLLLSAERIITAMGGPTDQPEGPPLTRDILDMTFAGLAAEFDQEHGGFGRAPKFPLPHRLSFLLRYAGRTANPSSMEMVEKTLRAMRCGGIFDQVGFGFHRYSTDEAWLVPHFEKMLYDQALLALAYTEAYQLTGRAEYARTVEDILAYVQRDLTSKGGGFLTAEDADSEGEEGRFYLWEAHEINENLPPSQRELAARIFDIRPEGNYAEAGRGQTGKNILYLRRFPVALAAELNISEVNFQKQLGAVRENLFHLRTRRHRPLKDSKILTDWNGLMIAALAKAARALSRKEYAGAARKAAEFIRRRLEISGKLHHRWAGGEPAVPAFLDDYAFLIWGLIELYETEFDPAVLEWAYCLTEDLLSRFWDKQVGGFFFTPSEYDEFGVRRKELYDGAVPSGNSVMLENLLRLGRLTGRVEFEKTAEEMIGAFAGRVSQAPINCTQFLCGLDSALGPTREIVIVGRPGAEDTLRLLDALGKMFLPRTVVLFRPAEVESPPIVALAPYTRPMTAINGLATAYICANFRCEYPTADPREMVEILERP